MPKKGHAQIVNQTISSVTDSQLFTNNVSSAANVKNGSFGSAPISKNVTNLPGSASGFKKAIPSAGFQNCQDTAHLKSNKSKTIGSIKHQSTIPIFLKSHTAFTTVLTSGKTTASSQS